MALSGANADVVMPAAPTPSPRATADLRTNDGGQPGETGSNLTLYQIESGIEELLRMREDAEAEGDSAALVEIDKALADYARREVRKLDGIAAYLRHCEAQAELAAAEATRLKEVSGRWAKRAERLEQATLAAMQAHGLTKIETACNSVTVQGNGGQQPLETDMEALPTEYHKITVTMPFAAWLALEQGKFDAGDWIALKAAAKHAPDNDRIRKALERGMPCTECRELSVEGCPRCDGTGWIKPAVSGARLLPRGSHLRWR